MIALKFFKKSQVFPRYKELIYSLPKASTESFFEAKRAETQHTSLGKCEKERSRLLDISLRSMVDDDLFETKDCQLRERIERIKEVSKDAQEHNKNWCEVIGKTLETLRSPKEKMQAAETAGERRVILQAIGPVAKLVERKIGTYKNGRDLTRGQAVSMARKIGKKC